MYKKFFSNLFLVLMLICIVCFCFLATNMKLITLGLIALSLGLRHGLDADHIVAIDNITRKFISEQKNSLMTGLYFALGHSTIVFLLTLGIVLSIPVFHGAFNKLQSIGSVVGTSVSVAFLWVTALMNLTALSSLLENKHQYHIVSSSSTFKFIEKNIFNKIDQPNKMYFVGFLFGLGFDTATEIGLLGMTATAALHGLQPWLILLLPILFACGMVLTDSLDCVLMNTIYNRYTEKKTKLRNYKIAIIGFITLSAFVVGLLELFSMLGEIGHWENIFTHISRFLGNHLEEIGASIIIFFIILWLTNLGTGTK